MVCRFVCFSRSAVVRSSWNFKLNLIRPNQPLQMFQLKANSNGRRPQILKVIHLSSHWSDIFQIFNLTFGDQTKLYKCFKWRQPPMEMTSNMKMDISLHPLVKSSPSFKLKLVCPNQTLQMFKWRQPQILKAIYLSNHKSKLSKI